MFELPRCVSNTENHEPPSPVHRRSEFAFTVNAAYEAVAPLFGAHRERLWANGWNPQFLHPLPANDQSGAVFTVTGGHSNVWINTVYDLDLGHVQYACFATDAMVTLIDIRLQRLAPSSTSASVVYERTALHPGANDHVNRLADQDESQGTEWQGALRTYFENCKSVRTLDDAH